MRLLLMQQKMIGDVLTSGLLAENLRTLLPGCEVHFLAHSHTHPVLVGNPHLQAIHGYPSSAGWSERTRIAQQLRRLGFDVLIDVYAKLESLLLAVRIGARRRIGYRKWYTRALYTDPVARPARSQWALPLAVEHRLRLLEPLTGPLKREQLAVKPRLYLGDAEQQDARSFLSAQGVSIERPLLMVSALGSSAEKSYPLPAMARLLDRIAGRSDAQLLFNFVPSQRPQAQALLALCAPSTQARIALDATPGGLREFIAVLGQCRALFGNEGGAANMAKALDVPSFSVFAPQIPQSVWGSVDAQHPSVHLAQFHPELFVGQRQSVLKQSGQELYARFDPVLIEPALDAFIDQNLHQR